MLKENGIKLNVMLTREEFKRKETSEQLLLIFEAIRQGQKMCSSTMGKYDQHFQECDEVVQLSSDVVETLRIDIKDIRKRIDVLSAPIATRRKDMGVGAGTGSILGITLLEAGKYLWVWLKAHLT